jgi:hypothetical protein
MRHSPPLIEQSSAKVSLGSAPSSAPMSRLPYLSKRLMTAEIIVPTKGRIMPKMASVAGESSCFSGGSEA